MDLKEDFNELTPEKLKEK